MTSGALLGVTVFIIYIIFVYTCTHTHSAPLLPWLKILKDITENDIVFITYQTVPLLLSPSIVSFLLSLFMLSSFPILQLHSSPLDFFFLLSVEDISKMIAQTPLSRSGMSTTQQKTVRFAFSLSSYLCYSKKNAAFLPHKHLAKENSNCCHI